MSNELRLDAPTPLILRAAESAVRRKMDRCDFGPEHLRILDWFIERSFIRGRVAMYFSSWRVIGRATENGSHAHELVHGSKRKQGLIQMRVVVPLSLANSKWHWYRWNLNFLEWPSERTRPREFWEEPPLPFEPELLELVQKTTAEEWQRFAEQFSASSASSAATTEMEGGRDVGPAPVPGADKGAAESNTPSPPTSAAESGTMPPQSQQKVDWDGFKKALRENRVEEWEREQAMLSVPCQGTTTVPQQVYPNPQRTPPGYTANANKDGPKADAVPSQGTYPSRARALASLACTKKAQLATASVPPEGTRTPEKTSEALRWLNVVDPVAMGYKRFAQAWAITCDLYPDYVLNKLRGALEDNQRRVAREEPGVDPIANRLGWLAKKAREDGRMNW